MNGKVRSAVENRLIDLFGEKAALTNSSQRNVEDFIARRTDYLDFDL
jgi:hypothetical protein